MYFATGIGAGETKFLWNQHSFTPPPASEGINTKARAFFAGTGQAMVMLSAAPGAGQNVTVTPVINGADGTPIVVADEARVGNGDLGTLAMTDLVSFKAALSAGAADVGNITVAIRRVIA